MKKTTFTVCLIFIFCLLVACSTEKPMPFITYDKPIEVHCSKNVILLWQYNEVIGANNGNFIIAGGGLVPLGVAMYYSINADKKRTKEYSKNVYGIKQQMIFIKSLQNLLQQNKVFKKINLIVGKMKIDSNQIYLIIRFKETRVGLVYEGYPITLDVNMAIKYRGKNFSKNFFIYNDKSASLAKNRIAASKQLMDKIVESIKGWCNQNNQYCYISR